MLSKELDQSRVLPQGKNNTPHRTKKFILETKQTRTVKDKKKKRRGKTYKSSYEIKLHTKNNKQYRVKT